MSLAPQELLPSSYLWFQQSQATASPFLHVFLPAFVTITLIGKSDAREFALRWRFLSHFCKSTCPYLLEMRIRRVLYGATTKAGPRISAVFHLALPLLSAGGWCKE